MSKRDFLAYFNIYYNAQSEFRTAERLWNAGDTTEARQHYKKVIEKGAKLLRSYPTSKYVDDAIFLMGVSMLRTGDVRGARRKFEELLTYYPESPFVPKAHLYLGEALGELKKPYSAVEHLDEAAKGEPSLARRAAYLKVRAFRLAGMNREAVEAAKEAVEGWPGSREARDAAWEGALAAREEGMWQEAQTFLREYLGGFISPEDRARATMLLGEIELLAGNPDSALATLSSVDLPPGSKDEAKLKIMLARAKAATGDTLGGKALLREVLEAGRPEERAEAAYWLGLILEAQDSLDAALEIYERAKREGGGLWASEAANRAQALSEWKELENAETPEELYRRAEIMMVYLGRGREACEIFEQVKTRFPKTPWAPKSLYALTWWFLRSGDTSRARTHYRELVEKYPRSVYARFARESFGKVLGGS